MHVGEHVCELVGLNVEIAAPHGAALSRDFVELPQIPRTAFYCKSSLRRWRGMTVDDGFQLVVVAKGHSEVLKGALWLLTNET